MPALKRSYHIAGDEAQQIAKRLRRVERSTRLNRAEMKHITFSVNGTVTAGTLNSTQITNIAQGDGIANRTGDRIRVWRVEVRGLAQPGVDNYLIQLHTTTLPLVTDFTSSPGAMLLDSNSSNKFSEWKQFRNRGVSATADCHIGMMQRFRNGIIVKYGGTGTQPVDNGLVICQLNRLTSDLAVKYTIRVYFTDP